MMKELPTLEDALHGLSREGELYSAREDGAVRCYACGHECLIRPGRAGVCRVRYNEGGKLRVPYGYVAGIQCDPIEKKPFFHAFPGGLAFSFGMLGCDLHCSYCQNWVTSQTLRDPVSGVEPRQVTPETLVALAKRYGASVMTSTYNEPLITAEWSVAVFKAAKAAGIPCSFVSNGNATPAALDYLQPHVSLYKVDLKTFQDSHYRKLGGRIQPILDTIGQLAKRGFWVEIVTLTIPGFNDSDGELKDIAQFLLSISPDIPWHVTAFHKDYKMTDPDDTPAETLLRAREIGLAAGLRYVYAGNLPGRVGDAENTNCPTCHTTLVQRYGYRILRNRLMDGACPKCRTSIPGFWTGAHRAVQFAG